MLLSFNSEVFVLENFYEMQILVSFLFGLMENHLANRKNGNVDDRECGIRFPSKFGGNYL